MRFFAQNETIILFAQGLVFFALGFAVWLQRRRATRLRLTSSLVWLAAFAFFEALAVWGYVFVPIQETYLSAGFTEGLLVLRALLQTAAFLFLLQFGLRLIEMPTVTRRSVTALSLVAWGAILAGFAVVANSRGWSVAEWESSVTALSRYLILAPAALLSAFGLWRQRSALAVAEMPGIRPFAATAAGVLVAYALVAGLIVDAAPWVPGGILNEDAWLDATGFQIQVLRGLAGLVLCVAAVKLLEIFEVEDKQRLEALDRARAVAEERTRFSRDLHDGTIQSIYAAGLHLEAISIRAEDPALRSEVRAVVEELNQATDGIRDYIRDLTSAPDTAEGIATALSELAAHFSEESDVPVQLRARGVPVAGPLPEDCGQHLQQILREALANVARHAGSCAVDVRLGFAPDEVELVVRDDGCGFGHAGDSDERFGHGVRNMRERARRLGGRLTVDSPPGGGTVVAVSVPLDADIPAESESPDHPVTMGAEQP
ncbi:MAG: sensor histidine kinase [Miltoncostaeaceae bacterium]